MRKLVICRPLFSQEFFAGLGHCVAKCVRKLADQSNDRGELFPDGDVCVAPADIADATSGDSPCDFAICTKISQLPRDPVFAKLVLPIDSSFRAARTSYWALDDAGASRHCPGVMPVTRLNARINAASDS